jgi:hypothetical protein
MSLAVLVRRIYNNLIGTENLRYGTLPTSADGAAAAAVTLTAAAAWTFGAWAQIALAAVVAVETQIVGFTLENFVGAASQGEIEIGIGVAPAGAALGRYQSVYGNFILPKPIRIPAATAVVARYRTSTGAADTVDVKLNTITVF